MFISKPGSGWNFIFRVSEFTSAQVSLKWINSSFSLRCFYEGSGRWMLYTLVWGKMKQTPTKEENDKGLEKDNTRVWTLTVYDRPQRVRTKPTHKNPSLFWVRVCVIFLNFFVWEGAIAVMQSTYFACQMVPGSIPDIFQKGWDSDMWGGPRLERHCLQSRGTAKGVQV